MSATVKPTVVSHTKLQDFMSRSLQKVGVLQDQADLTAHILVQADLRGVDSHGVNHLYRLYIQPLMKGQINTRPNISVQRGSSTTAVVHGDRGLGFVVAHRAMSEAIAMAKQHGSGWVTVRNSRHFGAGAYYAMMALEHDMIGFSYTTGGKLVAAAGGKGRFMGVNVIAVAAPGRNRGPFVLDMACSVVAGGKMELAVIYGGKVPEGFAIDGNGRPLTDANLFWKDQGAALLPLGGTISHGAYKGFGLALIVEILAGFLSGSGGTIVPGADGPSHFFGALRIDAFPSGKDFKSIMNEAIERIKAVPPVEGNKEVMYPGERENRIYQERLKNGIPLHPDVIASLKTMCQDIGMPFDLV